MTTKKLFATDAVRLRIILVIVLCLLIVGAIGISGLSLDYLNKRAVEVQQVVAEANSSNAKLQRVQELTAVLNNNQDAVDRAKQVVAESKSYQYQDVIIEDLQAMAKRAGVTITNFNFSAGKTQGAAAAPAGPAAAAAPAPTGGGLQSTTVNIALKTPVDYRKFLTFIHYIEQNLTKMQISKVGLAGVDGEDNTVESETLTIEVYIR